MVLAAARGAGHRGGSRHDPRGAWLEEADIELMAMCDELVQQSERLQARCEALRDRAMRARVEIHRLRGGEGDNR